MANRKTVVYQEDGTIPGLGSSSSDEEENGPGEPTNPRRAVPGTQATGNRMSTPYSVGPSANTRHSVLVNHAGNIRHNNPIGGGRG